MVAFELNLLVDLPVVNVETLRRAGLSIDEITVERQNLSRRRVLARGSTSSNTELSRCLDGIGRFCPSLVCVQSKRCPIRPAFRSTGSATDTCEYKHQLAHRSNFVGIRIEYYARAQAGLLDGREETEHKPIVMP